MATTEEELRAEIERLREALKTQAKAVQQLSVSSARRHELDAQDAATLRRREATPGDTLAELATAREEARAWNARATTLETEQNARYFEGLAAALEACRGVKVTMLALADRRGGPVACYDAFGEEDPYQADSGECEMIAAGACLCVEAIEKLMAQPK